MYTYGIKNYPYSAIHILQYLKILEIIKKSNIGNDDIIYTGWKRAMSKLFSFGKLISKNKDDALHESESPKITDDQPEETDISDQMENQIANPETSADKDISRYTSDDIIDENNTATRMRRSSLLETMEHDLKIASENLNQQELFLRQSREQLRNFRSFMTSHEVDFETIARLKSDLRTATIEGARLTTINQSLRKQMEAEKASAASLRV